MIEYKTLLSMEFFKKTRFTGSYEGMRFEVKMIKPKEPEEKDAPKEPPTLKATICPGPFALECTREDLFESEVFPFSDEGKNQAVDWMNQKYLEKQSLFQDVFRFPMKYYQAHHRETEES